MTLDEWVRIVCIELDIEAPQLKPVLDFARDVAHRVDRPAAPLTSLLIGIACATTADVPVVIERIRRLLPTEPADQPASPSR